MRKFSITEELIVRIATYLETKPYKEVALILADIMNLKHIEELDKESPEILNQSSN